jgi:hypothetical protein
VTVLGFWDRGVVHNPSHHSLPTAHYPPAKCLQRYPPTRTHVDTLGHQTQTLCRRRARGITERDPARGIDHAVPWDGAVGAQRVQGIPDEPGLTR